MSPIAERGLLPGAALAALLSCGTPAPLDWQSCPDAPCRQAWALETWTTNEAAVRQAVVGLGDPIEQEALLLALSEAWPGQLGPLCPQLSAGAARKRCENLANRPHLRLPEPEVLASIEGDGPAIFLSLARDSAIADPFAELPPATEVTCAVAPPTASCWTTAALATARLADGPGAAALCRAIEDTRWRQECLFQAAEAALQPVEDGPAVGAALPVAMELCLGAGTFRARCLQHLVNRLAASVPRSHEGQAPAALEEALALGAAWLGPRDPALAGAFVDNTWSTAAWMAFQRSEPPCAAGVAGFPEAQLRSALAIRVVQGAPVDAGLLELQGALDQALGCQPVAPASLEGEPFGSPDRWLWTEDLPGEAELPWVHFPRDLRRPTHPEARVDGLLALVEAAGRVQPVRHEALLDAVRHEEARVRWSGARLLGQVGGPWKRRLPKTDPDPLVRGRLEARP